MSIQFKLVNEDQLFPSMLALAKHLGKSRIYRKDFERLGVMEIEVAEDETDETEDVIDTIESTVEVEEQESVYDQLEEVEAIDALAEDALAEDALEQHEAGSTVSLEEIQESDEISSDMDASTTVVEPTPPAKPAPQYVLDLRIQAGVETINDLYKKIRGAKYEDVIAFAESLELGWDENPNPKVNRMNVAKSLREALFPGEKRPHRPKSPWYGTTMEYLRELANANNVEIKPAPNEKIERMWIVKGLRDKGIEKPPTE